MGLRSILFWPIYRIADWIDDNPVSATGVVVALAALAVLVASAFFGVEASGQSATAADASLLFDTAVERPAYLAAVLVGIAVVLFYNG